MWKKIFSYYKFIRRQFFFYFLVGGSATILDLATLALFKEVFGWKPITAVIINQILIVNYVFFLNKYVTFGAQGKTLKRLKNFIILTIWNYIF
ncbi:MAG: GtrA family protein, partial [Candidatus Magasanikbacteria bacterium]|nr:GtrA family protein [Candidatus Magasanikbacteria bacterium]